MKLRGFTYGLFSHIAFILLWQVTVVVIDMPSYILPTPFETILELFDGSYSWWLHTWVTSVEIFGGYLLAIVVGVVLAVLFVWIPLLNSALMPLLVTLNMTRNQIRGASPNQVGKEAS